MCATGGFEGTWTNGPQDVSGGPVTLTGLPLGSAFGLYQVQVRATNTAGDGPWSESAREILFPPEEEAAADYGLVPAGVRNGDSFRLLFITHATTTAESDQGFSFDESVVKAVVDSQGRWPFFRQSEGVVSSQRALVSTPGVDARVRTDTTFTAGDKGVPIYWLRGAKVADDYEDFYDGDWDDEASPTDSTAKVVTVTTQPWTGSSNDGTELFAGTVSLALGRTRVGIAGLGSTTAGHGPLSGGDVAATGMLRPLFGLSQVYVVRDNLLASNMAQTGGSTDKRSARRSQRFTTGSNPGGYALDSVTFSAQSASDTTAITYTNWSVSVYTVDAMGHPATEHAALAAPEPHIVGGNVFTAPAGTTLSADTTYAVVVTAGTTISTVGFGLTTTDLNLEVTTSNGENERSASDWSIFDAFDIRERQQLVGGHGRQGAVHRRPRSPGPGQAHRPERHPERARRASTCPGPPRPTTAARPSPATGSRSPPTAPPGPTWSPIPAPPRPPTPTPASPSATPATTASPPSTSTAPARPPTPPWPPSPVPPPAHQPLRPPMRSGCRGY